jgi:hypothetical protein
MVRGRVDQRNAAPIENEIERQRVEVGRVTVGTGRERWHAQRRSRAPPSRSANASQNHDDHATRRVYPNEPKPARRARYRSGVPSVLARAPSCQRLGRGFMYTSGGLRRGRSSVQTDRRSDSILYRRLAATASCRTRDRADRHECPLAKATHRRVLAALHLGAVAGRGRVVAFGIAPPSDRCARRATDRSPTPPPALRR